MTDQLNPELGASATEKTPSVIEQMAAMTGSCSWNPYGQHNWLPWLRLDNDSFVTRCLACGRQEQWDQ